MPDDTNSGNKDNQDKKKQKPGLNAVRPDDYTEKLFKEMAKDSNISQTDLFNRIFWNYINDINTEKKEQALNLESEVNLISQDLSNILNTFKGIVNKAQNTVLSIKSNAEQTEINLTTDIDTLKKENDGLRTRNDELEQSNIAFTEIRTGLENKNLENAGIINDKEATINLLKEAIKEKDKKIRDTERELLIAEKDVKNKDTTIRNLQGELDTKDTKIRNLETTNLSLHNTLDSMESLKKSELSSIEARYQTEISELKAKIKTIKEETEKTLNAEKMLALADITIELANYKIKYAEAIKKPNVKNTKNTK